MHVRLWGVTEPNAVCSNDAVREPFALLTKKKCCSLSLLSLSPPLYSSVAYHSADAQWQTGDALILSAVGALLVIDFCGPHSH